MLSTPQVQSPGPSRGGAFCSGSFLCSLSPTSPKPFRKTNFKPSKVYTSLIKRGYFLSEYLYSSCCVIARCLWSALNCLEAGCWVFLLVCLSLASSLLWFVLLPWFAWQTERCSEVLLAIISEQG